MSWQSIAILSIMLLYVIYGVRANLLARKIRISLEADYEKDEKVARLTSNVRAWGVVVFFAILVLFFTNIT